MKKQEKQNQQAAETAAVEKEANASEAPVETRRGWWHRQAGGIYYHAAVIAGNKNVFVPEQYVGMMINALKMAELKKDIKNLAFAVMPNHVLWMFKLSSRQDNPIEITSSVKKETALGIINELRAECKNGEYERASVFAKNKRVGRSPAGAILWKFQEIAKEEKVENKKFRIWKPKTELRLVETSEELAAFADKIMKAPLGERWQLVKDAKDYPYLYVAEDLAEEAEKLERRALEQEAMEAMALARQEAAVGA